ncbi:DUF764 family protein (plasmid) [Borrelia nietonii YOR]|uniref:DUF764 family protein n=1 Tax=Borrelia nietonii TaxID=3117462 RepID=UPI001FF5B206|nr:DUF764 family protein [Borrelia nietonii]UPA10177.1 DUF764 family protein [Borrelia nietonii YOR]
MILDITTIKQSLISVLKDFTKFASIHKLDVDIINTHNHPYMSEHTVKKPNILAIKFENLEGLFNHNLRTGSFYKNVNEFGICFQIYFMAFANVNKNAYKRLMSLYTLFSDFLHDLGTQRFTFKPEEGISTHEIELKFYIYATTNMQNSGLIDIESNYSKLAYSASCGFKANVQVKENQIKEEEQNATRYNQCEFGTF